MRSRGLGDVYKRQDTANWQSALSETVTRSGTGIERGTNTTSTAPRVAGTVSTTAQVVPLNPGSKVVGVFAEGVTRTSRTSDPATGRRHRTAVSIGDSHSTQTRPSFRRHE